MYDPTKCRAFYYGILWTSLECLIGSYSAVGAVSQDDVNGVLLVHCHVKLLVSGMFVFGLQLPYGRSPHSCEICHLTLRDLYLLTRSVVQNIKFHIKYGHGMFPDTVDRNDLACFVACRLQIQFLYCFLRYEIPPRTRVQIGPEGDSLNLQRNNGW